MSSSLPVIAIVGDSSRAEMKTIALWVSSRVDSDASIVQAKSIELLKDSLSDNVFPDLIVIFQGWSGEYSARDVSELLTFAPLARIVLCYGAWCESDGRNYSPWPSSVRVPVWSAISRIEREWSLIRHSKGSLLPVSASREEVFAADHPLVKVFFEPQQFLVISPDASFARFVLERMQADGHFVVSTCPTVVLFDADPWSGERADALNELKAKFPMADVCVLVSQSEPKQWAEFANMGVAKVIHKLGFHLFEFPRR